ncbi:MAG: serine O-acetyltransferase [Candidatus Aquicultor secundus]|uniref:Serine acetyltransferase n=1 Tax=Candidatus Aquicultor secundus TaxID=1973895 RepID=A0A2M7T5U0_9ACTN|nr:serine O-acetyltransferase [Solirubrobacter sp.]OIO87935.1 MAG: serine O-acetyltransferase [Candidatus Aquicultor secundus]PIU26470.1 MAG: serine O-acetyltransferase [Candidatus Aquicultor secundus]PIW21925.1 MAG: serine O-acetyltransferase [Candidatus Aquicultor secundus]PIY41443.1 MAG: serine O-acetyltransferase [Candidatus Aquicultor secundus]
MFRTLKEEINTTFEKDPAAKSVIEVLLCYPGFHAIMMHRLAHYLYKKRVPLIPRVMSQFSRFVTGIEIHPGATIGRRFFIDHGMGVVIGETTEIGDDVLVYQNATLGGTGKEKGKRHPTLGNHVVVGAGAKVLGAITVGDNVKVGAGSVLVRSVPANTTIVGIPGRVVMSQGQRLTAEEELQHGHLPDPEAQAIKCLGDRIRELEQKIDELAKQQNAPSLRLVAEDSADGESTTCDLDMEPVKEEGI